MDNLAGLEPQLAIPVILVVVGAVLVYIFGFKQTEEPSYEHLAVLQSSSSYKNRSVTTNNPKQTKSSATSAVPAKSKTNGHAVPTANGVVKKEKAAVPSTSRGEVNKENKPPQVKATTQKKDNVKDPSNKPEDFESGNWIPAVSRKDKGKKKEGKQEPASPGKKQKADGAQPNGRIPGVTAGSTTATTTTTKAPKIEDLLAEMKILKELESQKQNHSTPETKAEKEAKPQKVVQQQKPQEVEVKKEEVTTVTPPSQPEGKAVENPKSFKSNIAFDEMGGGDSWEEAKSRGAKKRRTRKD